MLATVIGGVALENPRTLTGSKMVSGVLIFTSKPLEQLLDPLRLVCIVAKTPTELHAIGCWHGTIHGVEFLTTTG